MSPDPVSSDDAGSAQPSVTDTGYFGPGSVTWAVIGQPLAMVGGLRALILQALHPEAMLLLSQRTRFQDDSLERIRRTAEYVQTVTFGPRQSADAAAARVRTVHEHLGIGDPEQMAWVHACEVDSFLEAAARAGIRWGAEPLSGTVADQFVAEQRTAGRLVGVRDELMPSTAGELADYFAGQRPHLRLTAEAVHGVRYVVAPPMSARAQLATPARVVWSTLAGLAVGILPRWARRMYRLPATVAGDLAVTAAMRAALLTAQALPGTFGRPARQPATGAAQSTDAGRPSQD